MGCSLHLPEYKDANGEPVFPRFKLGHLLIGFFFLEVGIGAGQGLEPFPGLYMQGVAGQHSPDGLTNFISSGSSATAINLSP